MSEAPESSSTTAEPSFEAKLAELESLVEALETGDLELAESLERFKRGVALSQDCRTMLDAAQQQVETLLDDDSLSAPEAGPDETSD
ncbi:exodeoxyribonuclease VII small subunit [Wenzhouxiangella sp. XN79A]|uniref:exodeoxyribonuclease VII small subunit n=1 Tax=Wenzhouxiangella sp. XN79A TaxID=2724193 RepID=UPI00144AEAF2|nr:exodeoxyribonuclease VII small subunit [Wenzhouxiangella sp. XN79A]NKI36010.1 exodeoxyribonuclease VII small subunit [Wenzhouxiangella sp. XN79A]